ncbi:hypothetical protein BpHYR1_002609 [Brachionus plicatilis]|uniref:Uncharacterized protein n=1 Tax=Brachionus plicatilis TaxID=10195 RepID=A0A3M7RZU2_BRAPC|nr:hypothetical protein BpHYR1_002609 [Brachionus plicatilis]
MSNLNQKKRKCISLETKLNFDKYVYVSIDSNFPERGLLSDVEIISSVNNTAQNDDSDSDVEIEKPKKPVISSKEAIDKINDLKDFFLNKNQDFSKLVDFLFNIENVVIEKCNTKQTSIKDFKIKINPMVDNFINKRHNVKNLKHLIIFLQKKSQFTNNYKKN